MKLPAFIEKLFQPVGNGFSGGRGSGMGGLLSWFTVGEPYPGAWQNNDALALDTVANNPTLFACVTLIASDIGKLRNKLVETLADGRTEETTSPAFSPVLNRPNRYQNHIQFKEWWTMCKLLRGNAYALKERDARGVVVREYLLDPTTVQPLIADDGEVFYQLALDNLNGLRESQVVVPASEIIHDRINCLFHPLVGLSPIFAAGVVANIGLKIINNSAAFFGNGSQPSGVILVPGPLTKDKAAEIKEKWSTGFSGANAGKTALLADGMTFTPNRMASTDAQMLELLKWTDEKIAACFHVPAYKVGVGPMPAINNTNTLAQQYYNDCLQSLIEQYELCQTEGLGLDTPKEGRMLSVELDLTGLTRMDYKNQVETLGSAVQQKVMTINQAMLQLNQKPLEGGDTVYMQQQDFPLAEIAKNTLAAATPPAPALPAPAANDPQPDDTAQARALLDAIRKGLNLA